MKKFRSIRTKAVFYTFLIAMVPIFLLGIAGTWYFQDVLEHNVRNSFLEDARIVSDLTDNYLDRAILFLEGHSDRAQLNRAIAQNNSVALEDQAERINDASPQYYGIFITDPAGYVLASHPYGSFAGKKVDGSRYITEPAWTGKSFITSPVHSNITGRASIFIGTPIVSNGSTIGYLVGALDGYNYYDILERGRASVKGECIFIVNSTGQIIAHHEPQYMESVRDFSAEPPVKVVNQGKEGSIEYQDPIEGGNWYGAYAPIPEYGWGVVVAQRASDALQPVHDAMKGLAAALGVLMLGAVALAFFAGSHITRPVKNINTAIDEVAEKGDFSQVDLGKYLPYDRGDELGNLARNFMSMSEKITAAKELIMGEKKRADFYIDVMGHDINNLNQVILANLELLQESDRMDGSQNRFLEGAILATRDSASIVKNVKAIQDITAEKPRLTDVDLDKVIRECIAEVPKPSEKTVEIRYTPRKGVIVKALPMVKLAFYNIIRNSIKYSGRPVNVEISVDEQVENGRKFYATTITDDGKGIPDETKQKLFTRFQEDTTVPSGTGLGLYTAKALTEASGGSLKVEDRVPGDYTKGTKVTISLPAAEGT